ncbi:hypothetical protein V8C44DRAFT_11600 [Trichoderma aethiopicum]
MYLNPTQQQRVQERAWRLLNSSFSFRHALQSASVKTNRPERASSRWRSCGAVSTQSVENGWPGGVQECVAQHTQTYTTCFVHVHHIYGIYVYDGGFNWFRAVASTPRYPRIMSNPITFLLCRAMKREIGKQTAAASSGEFGGATLKGSGVVMIGGCYTAPLHVCEFKEEVRGPILGGSKLLSGMLIIMILMTKMMTMLGSV